MGKRGPLMERDTNHTREVRRLHMFSVILGLWLLVAPYVLDYGSAAVTWNEVISALIVMGLGFARLLQPKAGWSSWGLGIMGIWLILSPFFFGYGRQVSAYWNELGMGIFLVILAFAAVGSSIRSHSHLAH